MAVWQTYNSVTLCVLYLLAIIKGNGDIFCDVIILINYVM